MNSVVGLAILAITCAGRVAAQVVGDLPCEARFVHVWPEPSSPHGLLATRARYCHVGDDDRGDVALLRSFEDVNGTSHTSLVYLPDAGRAQACVPLGLAQDFVVLPHTGANCADGLLALENDGSLTCYSCLPGQQMPAPQLVDTWPGTSRLWAVPNGSTTEVFGLANNGNRLRRATWCGQQLGPMTETAALPDIASIQGMDWDGDGVQEIVVTTASQAAVLHWDLSPVTSIPLFTVTPPMLRVSRSASHGDLLVAYLSDGTNAVVAWANAATSGFLGLGTIAAGAMTAYDRDGDGDEEIALADAVHSRLYVLLRQGNQFVLSTVCLLAGTEVPDGPLTAVAGGDLDGDGDGDLLAFAAGSNATHTYLDGLISDRRPASVHGDMAAASIGPQTTIPITVKLPGGLATMAPPGATLFLRFDGWLVDPQTGLVVPQRVLGLDVPVAPGQGLQTAPITFSQPESSFADFLLQLHVSIVAVFVDGTRRSFPSQLLWLTPNAELEQQVRREVGTELTGDLPLASEGGGDGNIVGTKTTKHEVGVPPF